MGFNIALSKGNFIEVADEDYAVTSLKRDEIFGITLNEGWRLPDENELKLIYQNLHRKGIGNFRSEWYWSKTSCFVSWDVSTCYCINFKDGSTNATGAAVLILPSAYVRLVRDCKIGE